MKYYIGTKLDITFNEAIDLVHKELKKEGFGVLTEIDIQSTFKNKLDVDFRKYKILGACNPSYAYKVLQEEDKIGLMLPCNFIVQELDNGQIEVAVVDPAVSMMGVGNEKLGGVANEVKEMLTRVIKAL